MRTLEKIALAEVRVFRLPAPYVERGDDDSDAGHAREVTLYSRLGFRLVGAMGHDVSPIVGTDRFTTLCPACHDRDASTLVYASETATTLQVACLAECAPQAIEDGIRRAILEHEASEARARAADLTRAAQDELARMEASVSILALGNAPDQTWAIEGLVPDGSLTLLAGAAGSGKTFVTIGWAISIGTGRPFCGRVARRGRVLCVFLDGSPAVIARRLQRLAGGMGTNLTELAGKVDFYPGALDVTEPASMSRLVQHIDRLGYSAIMIDNLSEVRGPGSENDASVLGDAMRPLAHLAQGKLGTRPLAVVLLHHANASGDVRGSTAIRQHADHVLTLERGSDRNEAVIEISRGKSRSGGGEDMRLRFVDGADAIVPTLVETATKHAPAADPVRARVLATLATTPMGSDSLATLIAKELGTRKASVIAMRRTLEDEGKIAQGDDGRWRLAAEC
ncbi:MAG: hypothetical protein JWP01_3381 [Myxococcales bacterium]|nr:hypothetical protein [Myxococcales bacterium]